jgi:tRNA(Leu) C34 or U34 (ribose-2'-O)-methylase TrmL
MSGGVWVVSLLAAWQGNQTRVRPFSTPNPPKVCVDVHASWPAFLDAFAAAPAPKRLVAFTVYGSQYYAAPEFAYRPGDWLLFGSETSGLPPEAHGDITARGGALVKVPISTAHVRSLNLATTVGIGLFEALRQLAPHEVAPRDDSGLRPTAMAAWVAAQQQEQQLAAKG